MSSQGSKQRMNNNSAAESFHGGKIGNTTRATSYLGLNPNRPTTGTAQHSDTSYNQKRSGGHFSMQRLPNKQGSMADSYYNLMGPEKQYQEAGEDSTFSPSKQLNERGTHYEMVNAQNINANIRKSMDKQQRVQTA